MTHVSYLGIDVGKDSLDLGSPEQYLHTVDNTPQACKKFATQLKRQPPTLVAVEATGGYERAIVQALMDAQIPVAVVQPACVRHFAKSLKLHAKTDRIDASLIARFAKMTEPKPAEKPDEDAVRLRALRDRRDQIVEDRVREQNRLEACADAKVASEIKRSCGRLKKQEEKLDEQIAKCIDESKTLKPRAKVLIAFKSVGINTAAALLGHLPELGQVNRQEVAALAGLAPYNCESGKWKGKRRIYGGRAVVRRALYMAAMSASRYDPTLRQFYQRLRKEGKLSKVALIAVARKLLIKLNTAMAKFIKENSPNTTPAGASAT